MFMVSDPKTNYSSLLRHFCLCMVSIHSCLSCKLKKQIGWKTSKNEFFRSQIKNVSRDFYLEWPFHTIFFLICCYYWLNEDFDDEGKLRRIYPDNSEEGGLIEQWIYGKIFECYHYSQQKKLC